MYYMYNPRMFSLYSVCGRQSVKTSCNFCNCISNFCCIYFFYVYLEKNHLAVYYTSTTYFQLFITYKISLSIYFISFVICLCICIITISVYI